MQNTRDKIIIHTGMTGILTNVILAGCKAVVGILTGSIAIVLDAVNNLSDVVSSLVTIIGMKLAMKMPDKEHPFGHGRIEYLSAMVVAVIVLYAGIASAVESVKKLMYPETAEYSYVSFLVIGAAVLVKIWLGRYTKSVGEKVNSGALIASGSDALFDAVLSFSTLLCGILAKCTGIGLEPYVGLLIAVVIGKAGIEMLTNTLDDILGKRADKDFLGEIRETIGEDAAVHGVYDLMLHSYGPSQYVGSAHVEVPDTMTAEEITAMERRIADQVLERHGVLMTGISVYAMNTQNEEIRTMHKAISDIIMAHDGVLQMHGFHADTETKVVSFDVIIDYALRHRKELFAHISADVQAAYPDYAFHIVMDIDLL